MWFISDEQQSALYALSSILREMPDISEVLISEDSARGGDGIEDLIVEFLYPVGKAPVQYFARIPEHNHIEIWSESGDISAALKEHVDKELADGLLRHVDKKMQVTYAKEDNKHYWKISEIK